MHNLDCTVLKQQKLSKRKVLWFTGFLTNEGKLSLEYLLLNILFLSDCLC